MTTAIYKLVQNKSPIMGTLRGYRILVARPNMAGRTFSGAACPAFTSSYLITQTLDFHSTEFDTQLERIQHLAREMFGVTSMQQVGDANDLLYDDLEPAEPEPKVVEQGWLHKAIEKLGYQERQQLIAILEQQA